MVTAADLKRDAVNSLDIDLTDTNVQSGIGKSYKQIADQAIIDATAYVESFLDKTLEITAYTDYVEVEDWRYNSARGQYTVYAQNHPITSVTTANVTHTKNLLISESVVSKVEYSAGYGNLPADIRRCISNIAMYLIRTSYDGLISWQSADKNIGGVQTTVSKDSMYIERELKKIEGYQRLH